MESKKSVALLALVLLFVLSPVAMAQTIVKAEIDSTEYHVGDVIRVLVKVENNPGLHSLFFDMEYNESVLKFEGTRDGNLFRRLMRRSELLYADNSTSDGFKSSRVVVSFSMKGSDTKTTDEGTLVELRFRVTKRSTGDFIFDFREKNILDEKNKTLTGVTWKQSSPFQITSSFSNEFIKISEPDDNEAIYADEATVNLILTEGNYQVRLRNNRLPEKTFDRSVQDGQLLNQKVSLVPGMNSISAELYSPNSSDGSQHTYLTKDSVKVYRSTENRKIKILDPADRALLNTDMVNVRVSSSSDSVLINGLTAQHWGEMDDGDKVFESQVWLSGGFNTITASAKDEKPDNILYESSAGAKLDATQLIDSSAKWEVNQFAEKYLEVEGGFALITGNSATVLSLTNNTIGSTGSEKAYRIRSSQKTAETAEVVIKDEVRVYYQKDNSIFNFVKPMADEVLKLESFNTKPLTIKGEIDSPYKTAFDPATGGPVKNRVSLYLTYIPDNPNESDQVLAEDVSATIEASDFSKSDFGHQTITSKYLFSQSFNISEKLGEGRISIVAYKNKDGDSWDDKITREVYIDSQRLWIDLVQPNIFTSDFLDSREKIKGFNGGNEILNLGNEITINDGEGAITLSKTKSRVESQKISGGSKDISGMNRITEAADGTLYGMVNASTSVLQIYKKKLGESQWREVLSSSGMYGYDMVSTPNGLLLGVSNIPSNDNSGLYLLSEGNLINFAFSQASLAHVQFVNVQDRTVYLYGNFYDQLYSFNLYDIEEADGKYKVTDLKKTPFPATSSIEQFILADGAGVAVIRTDDSTNNIHLYKRGSSGYSHAPIPSAGGEHTLSGKSIIYGSYESSDYESFLILDGSNDVEVLMRNRGTDRLFRRQVNPSKAEWFKEEFPVTIMGAGFADSLFTFVYKDADKPNTVYSRSGQIFFDKFYAQEKPDSATEYTAIDGDLAKYPAIDGDLALAQPSLFISSDHSIYWGIGGSTTQLYEAYEKSGSTSFRYENEDVEGLRGFRFEIDSAYEDFVDFGFSVKNVKDKNTDEGLPLVSLEEKKIADILKGDPSPEGYSLSTRYNGASGGTVIDVELSKLRSSAYFDFDFTLRSPGSGAPAIRGLEVLKKVSAKVTRSPGEKVILPIRGYVYDRTVDNITIQNKKIPLGRDRSFSYDYEVVHSDQDGGDIFVELHCSNAAGQRVLMRFGVEVVKSQSDFLDVKYRFGSESEKALEPDVESPSNFLIKTNDRDLVLSGNYYGLVGAVVGYEIYSSILDEEGAEPQRKGRFDTEKETRIESKIESEIESKIGTQIGTELEVRKFTDQKVELIPNQQRLVLFVENPGGLRHKYTVPYKDEKLYPEFEYSMPASKQEIEFDSAETLSSKVITSGIPISQKIHRSAEESDSSPYTFVFDNPDKPITGRIEALEQFETILVRSEDAGLVFTNGKSEIIIRVDPGNRFTIPFKAIMSDSAVESSFDVVVIPTIPVYSFMREGIRVVVKKDFKDTRFVPDLSGIRPDHGTKEESKNLSDVAIRFPFKDREDLPIPSDSDDDWVRATFVVNFTTTIQGYVDGLEGGQYLVRELDDDGILPKRPSTGAPMQFKAGSFKEGVNRIQWKFEYMEKAIPKYTISSSSGRAGMADEVFSLEKGEAGSETTLTFKPKLDSRHYYNNTSSKKDDHLPKLEITKAESTTLSAYLNSKEIELIPEDGEDGAPPSFSLPVDAVREGRNLLKIQYEEPGEKEETVEYSFSYDSLAPVVEIASTRVDANYNLLTELAVTVKEAHFSRGYLYAGDDVINKDPRVEMLGGDDYRLIWENLNDARLNSAGVKVEVWDRAEHVGLAEVQAFGVRDRPQKGQIEEEAIELPLYQGTPKTVLETGYENRDFQAHTVFAPWRMQKQIDVQDAIEDAQGVLINNGLMGQKLMTPEDERDKSDRFGESVSLSGDYALVGVPYYDGGGVTDAGAAYLFKKTASGGWEHVQTLMAPKGERDRGDGFGESVSLSDDYALVGASYYDGGKEDNDAGDEPLNIGAVYVFERRASGEWEYVQRLMSKYGRRNEYDFFGASVSLSGDYALVGTPGDNTVGEDTGSASLYKRKASGEWGDEQLLVAPANTRDKGAYFGASVSLSGDTALVGAFEDDHIDDGKKIPDAGTAYVFEKASSGNYVHNKTLEAPPSDRDEYDRFGVSVSLSGGTALVGAYRDDDGDKEDTGATYVFEKRASDWVYVDTLKAPPSDRNEDHYFGYSVSLSGDTALVGASSSYWSLDHPGGAYLFKKRASGWAYVDKPWVHHGEEMDRFGYSVSLSGDTAMVGAPSANNAVGAVHFFEFQANASASSASYLDAQDGSYLVFEVPKDPLINGLTSQDDMEGEIGFEVYGTQWHLQNREIIRLGPVSLSLDAVEPALERYVEGLHNLYYMVNIEALKTAFQAAAKTLVFDPQQWKLDPGSLRIVYDQDGSLPDFSAESIGNIFVSGSSTATLSDILPYDSAYYAQSQEGGQDYAEVVEAFQHPMEKRMVEFEEGVEVSPFSLSFWLRIEDEDVSDQANYRRVVTFQDENGTPIYHLGYKGKIITMMDEATLPGRAQNLLAGKEFRPVGAGRDAWNLVSLRFNPSAGSTDTKGGLTITVYDSVTGGEDSRSVEVDRSSLEAILQSGASFYFGADVDVDAQKKVTNTDSPELYKAGFYSLANPVFIHRWLTDDELRRQAQLHDTARGGTRFYDFTRVLGDYGLAVDKLRPVGESTDSYARNQNSDYTAGSGGSLKASSAHPNFLKSTEDGYVTFRDAADKVYYRLELTSQKEKKAFTLEPVGEAEKGWYYFGDKSSNYGLGLNRWYSVSGEVRSLDKSARLVMEVNGRPESWELEEGSFHFIYNNTDGETPRRVKLSIETEGKIQLSTEMILNQGNWKLPTPNGLQASAASTTFPFDLAGTVSFWYKPLAANIEGRLNSDVVLFDSEYVKIGARRSGDAGDEARFYAEIKEDEKSKIWRSLDTHVKVNASWQYLQFSYDWDKGVWYFYIDGRIAAFYEGDHDLKPFGSFAGRVPENNIRIGSDMAESIFAEGYIDAVTISKYYAPSTYEKTKVWPPHDPATLSYDSANQKVVLSYPRVIGQAIDDFRYTISTLDGSTRLEGKKSSLVGAKTEIDVNRLPAGRFRFSTTMEINGFEYAKSFLFNMENTPGFRLKDKTPLIFDGESTDILLRYEYDDSHRYESEDLTYAGMAVSIRYGADIETVYLVEDFKAQEKGEWLLGRGSDAVWTAYTPSNDGLLEINFPGVVSSQNIQHTHEYFYFTDTFDASQHSKPSFDSGGDEIPRAALEEVKVMSSEGSSIDYMLRVRVSGTPGGDINALLKDIEIEYEVTNTENGQTTSGVEALGNDLTSELYFDDIFPAYGQYDCTILLKYRGRTYANHSENGLVWSAPSIPDGLQANSLEIKEFSLLRMDKANNTAKFYLQYDQSGGKEITYTLTARQGGERLTSPEGTFEPKEGENFAMLSGFEIFQGDFTVSIVLRTDDFTLSEKLSLSNRANAPEIVLTNSPISLISYNDVLFSWKGYVGGSYQSDIEYAYDFDGQGFSTWSSQWRKVRFYNLEEGSHTFVVKSRYLGVESIPSEVKFFVDIAKPEFDSEAIDVENLTDGDGVLYAVNIRGERGAVKDRSLRSLAIATGKNGSKWVKLEDDGSFAILNIPITIDGINTLRLTAVDDVGNYTDYEVTVDNTLTTIKFPHGLDSVHYSPLAIVGSINAKIRGGVEIFLRDPMSPDNSDGSYTGWKKAQINADRTFFIEDVFINPGSRDQAITTSLKLVSRFESGKVFEREVKLSAKEILLPIELSLSRHSAEGESGETVVQIEGRVNLDNLKGISSWSIDYDGDGIYDSIDLVANPKALDARSRSWTHTYSSIGMVRPRVRVITTDGNFFSVSDSLIIHEKIREASHKIIEDPISFSSVRRANHSQRVFVLKGSDSDYAVEVYDIQPHATSLSHRQFSIDLTSIIKPTGDAVLSPVIIRAQDEKRLLVASASNGGGTLYQLAENKAGNYEIVGSVELTDTPADLTFDNYRISLSYTNKSSITQIPLTGDGLMEGGKKEDKSFNVSNTVPLGERLGLASDAMGLLVADYYNQRILRFTPGLARQEQFGSVGRGEKEFLSPKMIRSFENRIFVFDPRREDIQVFDQRYTPITTLEYRDESGYHNYLEQRFFEDLVDIDIMTREEGKRIYYYALLLSKTTGKLAMLRLPQWEELRAGVRNNTIVFLQDGEVFSAKPEGSDLRKILTTDSLPRIEGALDYPSLSPDGRKLVFTSRLDLYIGQSQELLLASNPHAYDRIYLYDIEKKNLERLSLGEFQDYEIERPVFNSNGDTLIFSAKKSGGRWGLYTLDPISGKVKKLLDTNENARFPYYSPDDEWIVFTTDYDGDEDIVIAALDNLETRTELTANYSRDSFPVWIPTYPQEMKDESGVQSKIAYVSEHTSFEKAIYYTYIQHIPGGGLNVVDDDGKNVGNDPDSAAVRVTPKNSEGDYPSFTGDGTTIVYEYFDGDEQLLRKHNKTLDSPYSDMALPSSAVRPAGMKNMITNFSVENINGNEIKLSWDRYTESDIFYVVELAEDNKDALSREVKVLGQTETILGGLQMGQTYRVRTYIEENGEEAATSRYQRIKIPVVAARPEYRVDSTNAYLVHLSAWKPDQLGTELGWYFTWIIDNQEFPAQKARSYSYEFSTSGRKTIKLKAYTDNHRNVALSEPFFVDIVSDIKPVIESVLAEDSSYVELSSLSSLGYNIDYANAAWTISGPGGTIQRLNGPKVIPQLDGFRNKISVTLTLPRIPVGNQNVTDSIVTTKVIDLDFRELLPVISVDTHEKHARLLKFSGQDSLGNIDWYQASWVIYADNQILHKASGVSTFEYLFPERNTQTVYTVSLTIPNRSDGKTETVSKVVSVDAAPIKPVVDYQIITLKNGQNVVGQKIIFNATGSTGNGIDFSQARWSVAAAAGYGEQVAQIGPVATYNLVGVKEGSAIEVALTLMRRGGADPTTVTEVIRVAADQVPESKLVVNTTTEKSNTGKVLILDVLKSTGPNIDWERTQWLIDDKYVRTGPVVRYDAPASGEGTVVNYSCTLYRHGATPEVVNGRVDLGASAIRPVIRYNKKSQSNLIELSVLGTKGVNIDWERTEWSIYDGNQDVIVKRGSVIYHAFALDSKQMGYPVMVKMYFTGGTIPFIGYKSVEVRGSKITPVITYDVDPQKPFMVSLSAESSVGAGIDWARTKWTFLDSAETQYGPVVAHSFPTQSSGRSYTVMMTLYRNRSNGELESVTGRKEIVIGADEIIPQVLAKMYDDGYLVLSAERSQGSGLLLDRALWTFPGKGDAVSHDHSESRGKSDTFTAGASLSVGVEIFNLESIVGVSAEHAWNTNEQGTSRDGHSTQNRHTGTIVRRYVEDSESNIVATLFVYRVTADGGTEGKSITVNINLNEARTSSNGVLVK